MPREYPRIEGHYRRPNKDRDGGKDYGKPCVVCGTGTCGEKWVQFSFMRGEDDTVRVCFEYWKADDKLIIEKMFSFFKAAGE